MKYKIKEMLHMNDYERKQQATEELVNLRKQIREIQEQIKESGKEPDKLTLVKLGRLARRLDEHKAKWNINTKE